MCFLVMLGCFGGGHGMIPVWFWHVFLNVVGTFWACFEDVWGCCGHEFSIVWTWFWHDFGMIVA